MSGECSHLEGTWHLFSPLWVRNARVSGPCHAHVNSADSVRSGDCKNAVDGKAKSRDTCATNCGAGTRERLANLLIHTFTSLSVSPCILGFHVHQFFLPVTSHTPFFTLSYISTTRACCFLDKTYAHVMHTGVYRGLSLSMPPTTHLRLGPRNDHRLSSN